MRQQGPTRKYVIVLEQKDKSTAKVPCCFCDKISTSGALRIREHLSGTANVLITSCNKVSCTGDRPLACVYFRAAQQ